MPQDLYEADFANLLTAINLSPSEPPLLRDRVLPWMMEYCYTLAASTRAVLEVSAGKAVVIAKPDEHGVVDGVPASPPARVFLLAPSQRCQLTKGVRQACSFGRCS